MGNTKITLFLLLFVTLSGGAFWYVYQKQTASLAPTSRGLITVPTTEPQTPPRGETLSVAQGNGTSTVATIQTGTGSVGSSASTSSLQTSTSSSLASTTSSSSLLLSPFLPLEWYAPSLGRLTNGDFVIFDRAILRIARGAVTSKKIKDNTIQGGDIDRSTNIVIRSLETTENLTVGNDLTVEGTLLTSAISPTGDIIPSQDDTYTLGDDTHRWKDIFLGGETLHIGTSTADEGTLSYDTTNNQLQLNAGAATPSFVITSGGQVGIGTTSPQQVLSVAGKALFTDTAGNHNIYIGEGAGNNRLRLGYVSSTDIANINSNDGTAYKQLNIDGLPLILNSGSGGNVGIGTAALSKLGVLGSASIGATYGAIVAPTSGLIVEGNVGIGDTAPLAKLQVGSADPQSSPGISARSIAGGNSNAFEWGHSNTAGYGSVIGYNSSTGQPWIAFSGEAGTTVNTFQTRGKQSSIIMGDLAGGMQFGNVATAAATDNQAFVPLVTILGTGNVGIGTTSPSSKLEVNGDIRITSGSGGALIFADGTSINTSSIPGSAGSLDNISDAIITGDSDANGTGDVIFKTGSNDRLHILNNGNVGIGTTSPGALLHLSKDQASAEQYIETFKDTAAISGIRLRRGRGTQATPTIVANGDALGQIIFQGYQNSSTVRSAASIYAEVDGTPGASDDMPGRIVFATTPDGSATMTERMRITNGGNVGIGTITPTANFQVAQGTAGVGTVSVGAGGTAWTGVGTQFLNTFKVGDTITSEGQTLTIATITTDTALTTNAVGAAISTKAYTLVGGTRFSVLGNGNVGIGTTNPTASLDIYRTTPSYVLNLTRQTTNGTNPVASINNIVELATPASNIVDGFGVGLVFSIAASDLAATQIAQILGSRSGANNSGALQFKTSDAGTLTERVRITPDGNVGIGTTGPSTTLDIQGTNAGLTNTRFSTTLGAAISLQRSNNATVGTNTLIANANEEIGKIYFNAANGTDYTSVARIVAYTGAGGHTSSADMPAYLSFMTVAEGDASIRERMRISDTGNVGIGTTGPLSKLSINGGLHVGGDSDAGDNNALIDGTLTVTGNTALGTAVTVNGALTSASGLNVNVTTGGLTGHRFAVSSTAGGGMLFYPSDDTANPNWRWQTNSTENIELSPGSATVTVLVAPAAVTVTGTLNVTGNTTLSGKVGLGTANLLGYSKLRILNTVTSDGSGTTAVGTFMDGVVTGAAGDTSYLTHLNVSPSGTITQTATEDIGIVATAQFTEPAITNNLTGNITKAATVYIVGPPTEGVTNASLWVNSGNVIVGGNTRLGGLTAPTVALDVTGAALISTTLSVGGTPILNSAVSAVSTTLSSTAQFGFHAGITGTSAGTSQLTAFIADLTTAAAVYTVGTVRGFYATNVALGAGSSVTAQYGLNVLDLTSGTTNVAAELAVSAGANKWNVRATGTADNAFAGNVRIGSVTAPTVALDVTGAALISSTLGVTGNTTISGVLGVGAAANPSVSVFAAGNNLTGTGQYGVYSAPIGSSAATSVLTGIHSAPTTAAAAFTATNVFGFQAAPIGKGAGSTITNAMGVVISDQTVGVNNFGLASYVTAGALKWNIYASGTADNVFAGDVRIGSAVAPTVALDVTGAALISSTLGVTGDTTLSGQVGLGGAILGYVKHRIGNTFTSNGGSTVAVGISIDGTITGAAGDTTYLTHLNAGPTGTITQTATESIAVISTARFAEPQITNNLTGSITKAATVFIANAPTEGVTNAALWVDTGNVIVGGNTRLGGLTAPTVALDVTGAALISTTLGVTGTLTVTGNTTLSNNVGIGAVASTASALRVVGTPTGLTGLSMVGIQSVVSFPTGGTTELDAFSGRVHLPATGNTNVIFGYRAQGHTTAGGTAGNAYGFYADDQTLGTTLNVGVASGVTAGAGKWNIYALGTADNAFAGDVRIGSVVAPTVALDVTGAALISSTLGVTGSTTISGTLGVGAAPNAAFSIYIANTNLTGLAQYGVVSQPVGSSAATSAVYGVYTSPATAAAAFTSSTVAGFRADSIIKGAGSTITSAIGVLISDQTVGVNNYGLRSEVSAGALKWNIYASGTANNAFAGNVRIGSVVAPTVALDVTGAALISTTLGVTGQVAFSGEAGVDANDYVCIDTVGAISSKATACTGSSSLRYKQNIENLPLGLDAVLRMRPVAFDWKPDYIKNPNAPRQIGFIAEEMEQISPLFVSYENGQVEGVEYMKLTSVLAKAIQELDQNFIGKSTQNDTALADLNLKTDQNITTVAGLQTSVDSQLLIASNKIDAITVADVKQSSSISALEDEQTTHSAALVALETTLTAQTSLISTMQTQIATLMDFYSTLSLGNIVISDTEGNVDLLSGKLQATKITTIDGFAIDTSHSTAPTLGTATLYPMAVDANTDGKDDFTDASMTDPDVVARDGKSIVIQTSAVLSKSRIFVTSQTDLDGSLAVTGKKSGIDFTVSLKKATLEAVSFDWLIVEEQ